MVLHTFLAGYKKKEKWDLETNSEHYLYLRSSPDPTLRFTYYNIFIFPQFLFLNTTGSKHKYIEERQKKKKKHCKKWFTKTHAGYVWLSV